MAWWGKKKKTLTADDFMKQVKDVSQSPGYKVSDLENSEEKLKNLLDEIPDSIPEDERKKIKEYIKSSITAVESLIEQREAATKIPGYHLD